MISIIIPARGTEPYLPHLVNDIRKHVSRPYEVLIQTEKEFGNAVLTGVKRAHGQFIVIMDADGSHNPKYLPEMIKKLHGADVVIGSRYVAGGWNGDTFLRKIASILFCKISLLLLRLEIRDPMSGFLALRKHVFERLVINPIGYKIGLEIIVKGRRKLRIIEQPIIFEKCKMGKDSVSHSNFKQAFKTFQFMFRLGVYSKLHTSLKYYDNILKTVGDQTW
ncbi:MAG: glycosyltransferase [Candidatus Bathyarchaeia archaeon]